MYGQLHGRSVQTVKKFPIKYVLYIKVDDVENLMVKFDSFV
jgi:hypothetical protein